MIDNYIIFSFNKTHAGRTKIYHRFSRIRLIMISLVLQFLWFDLDMQS